jgi:hypothetical protein
VGLKKPALELTLADEGLHPLFQGLADDYMRSGLLDIHSNIIGNINSENKATFLKHSCLNDDTYVIMCTYMLSLRKSRFKKFVIFSYKIKSSIARHHLRLTLQPIRGPSPPHDPAYLGSRNRFFPPNNSMQML